MSDMLSMHHPLQLCRMCGKEKPLGTDLFTDKMKGSVLLSIINKYFVKEALCISITDHLTKFICTDCEHQICSFDEFCLMVADVQKQFQPPSLELDFAEDMLNHLNSTSIPEKPNDQQVNFVQKKRQVCPICSKSFRCLSHLNRHKIIHTGLRPYVCDICNMSFNQQEIMLKHKQSHDGKKQFQCAHCHQAFRYKVSLKSHVINFHSINDQGIMNNHIAPLQDQMLQCPECNKQFATKYKLQRHRRYHTGEKPYHCNYCNRSFSQSCNLKLHQQKYHQILCPIAPQPLIQIQQQHHQQQHQQQLHLQQHQQQQQQQIHHSLTQPPEQPMTHALNTFQPMFLTETELQDTINETINSTGAESSYMNKSYENQLYIDDEIETMLDQDFHQLERQKYAALSQDKTPFCLKQPETPEILHSLLYDDSECI
ncbi:hypothetical protein TKK_0018050 [Trichogramma kaykai]|uniref:Protein krueppel n=1 Tax=Trichogramma kaykai TaxID=54128 RepID=A0ABD2W1M6_9HYME